MNALKKTFSFSFRKQESNQVPLEPMNPVPQLKIPEAAEPHKKPGTLDPETDKRSGWMQSVSPMMWFKSKGEMLPNLLQLAMAFPTQASNTSILHHSDSESSDDDCEKRVLQKAPSDSDLSLSISQKLQKTFELGHNENLKHEFACWLIKSVILQGYVYVTDRHLLYYCSLPPTSDRIVKSGFLKKQTGLMEVYTSYWFVLKPSAILLYNNCTDMYYPVKAIHLTHINQVLEHAETDIILKTNKKTIRLRADSPVSRKEWIQSILQQSFKTKNGSDDVRVVIPFENISEVSVITTEVNQECLKVSVIDPITLLPDQYLFAYFNNVQKAHALLSQAMNESIGKLKPPRPRPKEHRRALSNQDLFPPLIEPFANELELLPSTQGGLRKLGSKKRVDAEHRKTSSDVSPAELSYNGEMIVKAKKEDVFHKLFGFPESEILMATFNGSLIKVLPHLGRVYISAHYLSFKNHSVGIRCRAIIPLDDIVQVKKTKRYNVFADSLTILTKDQEEILFDFHTAESSQKCYNLLKELTIQRPAPLLKKKSFLDDIEHQDVHSYAFKTDELLKMQPLMTPVLKKPDPMHITVMTVGTRGDVQPYVALCKGFMADGHRCRIATHLEYKDWVEGFGIEFREIKGNPAELMQACVDHGFLTVGFMRFAMQHLRGWFDALLDSCVSACEDTDMIIEAPTAFGGMHMAEKMGVPFFRTFTMPWTRTQVYPHPAMVPDVPLGSGYNYMTHVMIEQVLWKCMQPQINHWRTKTLGLPQLHLSSLAETKAPFLYNFSPLVVPPPFDWPDWIHTCGFWFLENSEHEWTPPQSLTDFLNNGSKPIYIGFGSIVVADPDELTRIIVEAVKLSGVRVILSKGWSGRMQKQEKEMVFPDSIYRIDRIPHDWLFPQCQAVMHHGGAGTTSAGLRAGVPTIVKPFFGDQFFWADRVQDLGVGISLRKMTVQKLSQALLSISNDTKIQGKAKLMGERIRAENGVQNAIQFVYRDLQHWKDQKLS